MTKIQLRHDTAANWTSVNPILATGEIGLEYMGVTVIFTLSDAVITNGTPTYSNGIASNFSTDDYYTMNEMMVDEFIIQFTTGSDITYGQYISTYPSLNIENGYLRIGLDGFHQLMPVSISTNYIIKVINYSNRIEVYNNSTLIATYNQTLSTGIPRFGSNTDGYPFKGYIDFRNTSINGQSLANRNELLSGSVRSKIGDGTTAWNNLSYDLGSTALQNITSTDVTNALGYIPYNSSNPSGYISGITSANVTSALGYTPVNKAGDTMSGALTFTRTGGGAIALNAISEGGYSDIQYTKTDGLRVGFIRANNISSTERNIQISVCNDSGAPTSSFILKCNNNINSCTFPNTTCVDGQWTNTSVQLANNVSLPVGNEQEITYDLSSAIPNDNYKYEVVLNYGVQTGNSSGAGLAANIIGSGDNIWHGICDTYARGSWHMVVGGNVVVTVSTARTVRFHYTTVSKTGQLNYLYVEGYRRIGTNA